MSSPSSKPLTMEEEIFIARASSSTPKTSGGVSDDDIAIVQDHIYITTIDDVHKNINIDDEFFNYILNRFRFSAHDEEYIRAYLTVKYSYRPQLLMMKKRMKRRRNRFQLLMRKKNGASQQ
nr:hypothetical protein Itr_chr13CG05770 [Ipomoea trifida]